jgi:hypothetical protein
VAEKKTGWHEDNDTSLLGDARGSWGHVICSLQPLTSPLYEEPPDYCTAFRRWREDHRIGYRQAAKLLGIPATVISKMERGEMMVTEEDVEQFKKKILVSQTTA